MEAGGIEPPSESGPSRASTCVFRDLISPLRRPRKGFSEASSSDFSSAAVRAPAAAYPDLRRLSRPYGLEPVRRHGP